jgi:hypothetical protein
MRVMSLAFLHVAPISTRIRLLAKYGGRGLGVRQSRASAGGNNGFERGAQPNRRIW